MSAKLRRKNKRRNCFYTVTVIRHPGLRMEEYEDWLDNLYVVNRRRAYMTGARDYSAATNTYGSTVVYSCGPVLLMHWDPVDCDVPLTFGEVDTWHG